MKFKQQINLPKQLVGTKNKKIKRQMPRIKSTIIDD